MCKVQIGSACTVQKILYGHRNLYSRTQFSQVPMFLTYDDFCLIVFANLQWYGRFLDVRFQGKKETYTVKHIQEGQLEI